MRKGMAGLLIVGMLALSGCIGENAGGKAHPTPSRATVPAKTVRVYLATALACSKLRSETARFDTLQVNGPGYSTTARKVEDCREQQIFNSYVYDVPMPPAGMVTITPGNQPPARVDAAKATKAGAVTIFYARKGEGLYEVSTTSYAKDDAVRSAP